MGGGARASVWGSRPGPTVLGDLFARLRIKAVQYTAGTKKGGELRRESDGYRIVVNANAGDARARFTIAHEVAHAIIDPYGVKPTKRSPALERACDALAAAILMPASAFAQCLGQPPNLDDLRHAANKFQVSLHAAAIRCEQLTRCATFQ